MEVCKEIGKLENGQPDPCYDCASCDTQDCQICTDYDKYLKPDSQ